ncbi:MAG TPA: hypothetical protein VL200_16630 [Lacunisphaera sp.]|jgi:hypothetical protein|nr:hypothetical protein [Lacunisphaera sp.]
MQPDPNTPSRQGAGDRRRDKSGLTVGPQDIPAEDRAWEGVKESRTEDANPGGTEPAIGHPNRPERKKLGGNFNGPDKPQRHRQ